MKLLYDYLLIPDASNPLQHSLKHKHLYVKKTTSLEVTEFFLKLMAWICLRNEDYRNSQFCVVTGPNQDIAIKLIKRMKALFEPHNIIFDSKETVLELKCLQNRSVSFKLYWCIQSPRQSQVHLTRWSRFFQKEWTRRCVACFREIHPKILSIQLDYFFFPYPFSFSFVSGLLSS